MIAITFQRSGWQFEQLFRDGQIAVYFKSRDGTRRCFSYETIRIQFHDAYEIAGNHIEAGEHYPPSESWGHHGFTHHDYNAALNRAYKMVKLDAEKAAKTNPSPANAAKGEI